MTAYLYPSDILAIAGGHLAWTSGGLEGSRKA